MSANPATTFGSSFPRRRKSLFAFVARENKNKSRRDSRLRGNDGRFAFFLRTLVLLASLLAPALCIAQVSDPTPLKFRDAAEETRFHQLTSELRCVMCQNQSLADSDAPIAHDLRREVFNLMREGRSDAEIKTFLVERYGEFVLYRPPFGGGTLLLWLGPALVLLAGAGVLVVVVRRRAKANRVAIDPVDDGQEW